MRLARWSCWCIGNRSSAIVITMAMAAWWLFYMLRTLLHIYILLYMKLEASGRVSEAQRQ